MASGGYFAPRDHGYGTPTRKMRTVTHGTTSLSDETGMLSAGITTLGKGRAGTAVGVANGSKVKNKRVWTYSMDGDDTYGGNAVPGSAARFCVAFVRLKRMTRASVDIGMRYNKSLKSWHLVYSCHLV